jgi:AbrB family looped-hinge helix DNA binding protein
MESVRITSTGQMTIPEKIREEAGLGVGDVVTFAVENGGIVIRKQGANGDSYLWGLVSRQGEWDSPDDREVWVDF